MCSFRPLTNISRMVSWSFSEIRNAHLWPISVAITLIIACIFAITALAERVEQAVVKQGKEALTADTVFVSSNPIPERLYELTRSPDISTSLQTRFATMAFSDQAMKLVMVKSVDSRYPLRGNLVLADNEGIRSSVHPRELWLDERLFTILDISIGDNVTIGDADFQVTGRVVEEPGLSFNPFQQMPSVYIHGSDLDKTGAIQLGSRVRFSLFINAQDSSIESIKQNLTLTPSDRWKDQNTASRTNEVFQRTEQYLSLTVVIVVLMAATILAFTCQHYVESRRKTIAMLKSLGASKVWLIRWISIQILILFSGAIIAGVCVGIALEYFLRIPLVDVLPTPLPSYGLSPLFISVLTSVLICIPALGIPLQRLLNINALEVMQPKGDTNWSYWTFSLLLVPIIPMVWVYRDNTLIWVVLGGVVSLLILLAFISVFIMRLLTSLRLPTSFKLALSRMNRSPIATSLQFGALALSLMLLAVIWLVRSDLLSDWQRTVPVNAPNAFALNIAPYEKDAYLDALDNNNVERSDAYPIIRGRLSKINGHEAKKVAQGREGTDVLRREINFTYATEVPDHNLLLQGSWTTQKGVSVESDVAKDLNLEIGDSLEFVINGQVAIAEVNSIREVEWRDMKPNFYFIFTPDVLKDISATYLVSFRVESDQDLFLNGLSRNYPTVSLMDIRQMGAKIQQLLEQMVWSITLLAALGVVAGVLLIFTLLRLSLSQRQEEIRLYRTLGASKRRVMRTIWAEYGLLAIIAGLIAVLGAELVVAGVVSFGFDLSPSPHFVMWFVLPSLTFCTLALAINSLLNQLLAPTNKEFG
ncbi:ABC transporter permease [Vibrio aquimaris]|uniref:FtsX-like permease family protein n=1 Tax=Vibrio aquimaris TaxID=2587862 RepID=A0A5P9CPN3_9VIBR|nr:ABC transporter permease [Vibrio aquimaris]QFT27933.1 FtsX-like permease family protein [Vibrio aquimaris]